jgi:hypothetical protein
MLPAAASALWEAGKERAGSTQIPTSSLGSFLVNLAPPQGWDLKPVLQAVPTQAPRQRPASPY